MRKSKRGSITIESAICFSIVLVLLASLVNAMNVYRSNIYMQRSVRDVIKEFEYFTPLTYVATDVNYAMNEVLPEDTSQEFNNSLSSINNSMNELFDIDSFSSNVLDLALSHKVESRILDNYLKYSNSDFYAPNDINVDFYPDSVHKLIWVEVNYSYLTINGEITQQIIDVVPFWGDYYEFIGVSFDSFDEETNLWDLGNFDRGAWLRENFNTNLPPTFPVINAFENGEAISITSIDLNSNWNLNLSRVSRRLEDEISNLSGFEGANVNINGNHYQIDNDDIYSRRLIIVIPENSPEESRNLVYEYINVANSQGVTMEVIEIDES